jgi:transcriptional regulator GlxA family with amidase domain
MAHRVVVLALPGTIVFDLATPIEVFGRVRLPDGRPGYEVVVAGSAPQIEAGPLRLVPGHGLDALDTAETVVLPGREDPTAPVPEEVLRSLRAAAHRGARLASICVGAFTLAATGLLDGRRATTHWRAAELLRATHPSVDVDPAVLYVDNGQVLTSAGAAAGLDLCLYLVGRDHGAAAAADAARLAVTPVHRDGGQAQYVQRPAGPAAPASLAPVLVWLDEHCHDELTLDDIAGRAGVSIRTLNRRFHDETGDTPIRWLTRTRIRRAQELLETTDLDVESVGRRVGLRSASHFRAAFVRQAGVAPQSYRRTFRANRLQP